MKGRIENLGDYNTARILVQEMNGDLSALISKIENRGAHNSLPKHLGLGLLIGAPVWLGGEYVIKKLIEKRKKSKEKEKELEEELKAALLDDEEEAAFEER